MIRYGILDDLNEVIRWVWDKPDPAVYRFITKRFPRRPPIDFDDYEPAPF